ncbi:hypothetical protein BLNAU_18780 [Blattamonas nauphoetae]|uniref:Uncharacterized protein n=1 Tax=Blattamonas nauphoetae TaxID=2049346 RepID=A0ABQ9X3B9_9EUKA|nr:hypothetical protein BLNAU_18780 [Blattamonas nauphoetae]
MSTFECDLINRSPFCDICVLEALPPSPPLRKDSPFRSRSLLWIQLSTLFSSAPGTDLPILHLHLRPLPCRTLSPLPLSPAHIVLLRSRSSLTPTPTLVRLDQTSLSRRSGSLKKRRHTPPSPPHSQTESATDVNKSPSTSRISVSMQWMCDSPFKPALSVPSNEDELGLDDSDDEKSTPSLAGSRKESDTMLSATTWPRHSSLAKSPNLTLLSANVRPFVPSYSSSSFSYHPPQSVTPTFFPQPSPPPDTPFRKISTRDLQYLTQHEQNKIDERRRWKEWRGEIDAKYGIWASQRGSISENRMPSVPVDRGHQQESDSSSATRGRKKPMLNRREKREHDEWMRWG